MSLRVLDLFAGIGGFSLGLERTGGFSTVAFCERDEYCQRVLAKHWPGVPIHGDVTELDGRQFRGTVDVVCGGAPCQDISVAGKREGLGGKRSGLWVEFARLVDEARPRYAVIENVQHTWRRWVPQLRGALWRLGYTSVPVQVSANEVGANHLRRRVFIIANTDSERIRDIAGWWCGQSWKMATELGGSWDYGPGAARANDVIPHRVDRLRALGNAVVPQAVTLLGEAILASEAA